MRAIKLSDFKIRYFLTSIFYLVATVTLIHAINFLGVMFFGLDFLSWWPLGSSQLFGLGGLPDATLSTLVSGLSVEFTVPGLDEYFKSHWLTHAGLSLVTHVIFLSILGIFQRMLATVDVKQPFDPANIFRVKCIIAFILIEIFVLDYMRTQSMAPVKHLVDQMSGPMMGTDSSYQNADAYAYVLLLLLLTLLAIFRRGVILFQQHRELEKQLYQKRKMEALGTLASGVGHDFNNILTSIIGYAELAKSEQNKEERQFSLDQVLDACHRAKRLTQQVRAIGGQKHASDHEAILDLKTEVDELLLSIAPTIGSHIEVIKKFSPDSHFEVSADSMKLYQVLLNLCTNALQAMGNHTGQLTIDISAQQHNEQSGYCLSIQDNGCGMSKEQQIHIFEPYFTTREQLGGTGLGLSLSYRIIEEYGGYIDVDSKLNEGSCFKVWLPSATSLKHLPIKPLTSHISTLTAQNSAKEESVSINSKQILLVDDDQSILALAKRKLTGLGYQVADFNDCNEALNTFQKTPDKFDVVISDFNMPSMTGTQLASQVQAISPNKPVIIITGVPEQVEAGPDVTKIASVVSKPIAFSELHQEIVTALASEHESKS